MIIDAYTQEDDNRFLRWELIEKARQYYNPLPRCSQGFYAFIFMDEEQKRQARERDEKFEAACKIIDEILGDKK